jgi:predicted DNA-binding protein (MmcQ/YjbR family)
MYIESFRIYCLEKEGVTEDFPFGETTLVFRVLGKIFALTGLDSERFTVNLKADPDYTQELREQYPEVQPGFHMNKMHWNTVDFDGSLDNKMLRHLVDHSYEQTAKTLKKSEKEQLSLFKANKNGD